MNQRIIQKPDSSGFGSQRKGPESSGLPTDLINQASGRLEILVLIYAGIYFISFFMVPDPHELDGGTNHFVLGIVAAVFIASSLALYLALRSGGLAPNQIQTIGLIFEVYGAVGINIGVLSWNGDPSMVSGGLAWTTVWIVSFPLFLPAPPRKTFVAAMTTASIFPVMLLVLMLRGFTLPGTILAEPIVANYLCVGIAVLASSVIYGLGRDVAQARQMGSYRLSERLGRGGMGEVWKADHMLLARTAAIKLIRTDLDGGITPAHLERFEREVQATAGLRSPHTIDVYDFGLTSDGTFYYVMELLDGLDLENLVRMNGPLPPGRVVHILRQVCHSLAEAHQVGMVHRDIKPANIFICRYGRDLDFVKLLDFGLVKQARGTDTGDVALTQDGSFTGTPAYASPEMAGGDVDQVDATSDIYSLGCVAFWLLTGRTVFEASTTLQMLMKHHGEVPEAPSGFTEQELDSEIDRLILECLEKKSRDRIPSAQVLDARLRKIATTNPWSPDEAGRWWDQHRPERSETESSSDLPPTVDELIVTKAR